MAARTITRTLLLSAASLSLGLALVGQSPDVFVVGRDTATSGMIREFRPTRLQLPNEALNDQGRRQLVRDMLAEIGFAMRAIPIGPPGLVLHANGRLDPGVEEMKTRLYKNGVSVDQGDRFQITNIDIKTDRIIFDLNGGPYEKHRFLKHIEINGIALAPNTYEQVVGSRIILLFEGQVPNVTGPEVKSLLEPVLDFGMKTGPQAYAETLPDYIRAAVDQHEVLVGMTRRMVVASMGQPVMKIREHADGGADGEVLEEWIYGKQPQAMRFVRFRGDRVVLLKVAAMGKAIEVHDKDEMAGYLEPRKERVIAMGDAVPEKQGEDAKMSAKSPSLLGDGEKPVSGTAEKIKVPMSKKDAPPQEPGASENAKPFVM